MAQQNQQYGKPGTPVSREGALHSETTIYHPNGEEHPELDKAASSVPSAKKYLLWLLVAVIVIVVLLVFYLK